MLLIEARSLSCACACPCFALPRPPPRPRASPFLSQCVAIHLAAGPSYALVSVPICHRHVYSGVEAGVTCLVFVPACAPTCSNPQMSLADVEGCAREEAAVMQGKPRGATPDPGG